MTSAPETAFIRICVREPEAREPGALDRGLRAVADWPALVEQAGRHRVAALILKALAEEEVRAPANVEARLLEIAAQSRGHAMLIDSVLALVAPTMAAAGVPLIVLKGPVLAGTIYASRLLRPYDDLDVTVRRQDEAASAALLVQHGFSEVRDEREAAWRSRSAHRESAAPFHRVFVGAGHRATIELHTDPLQLGIAPVCEEDRWGRSLALEGVPGCLRLCPEDHLIQLSVHAHKHGFSRLIWLKDIDLLLRAHQSELDWDLALSVAHKEGVTGSVWYTLELLRSILGTPIPRAPLLGLRPAPWVRAMFQLTWPLNDTAELHGQMRRRAVQVRGADSWRGTLPSLLWMGRRLSRARVFLESVRRRGKDRDQTVGPAR